MSGVCVVLFATSANNPFNPGTGCFATTDARGRYLIDLTGKATVAQLWALSFKFPGYTGGSGLFPLNGVVDKSGVMNRVPTPTPVAVGWSRRTPAGLNFPLDMLYQDDLGKSYSFNITLTQTVRGAAALQQVKAANRFNSDPPAGSEYVLARLRFTYVSGPAVDKTFTISSYDFAAISSQGLQYQNPSVSSLTPALAATLYPGATADGWIAFVVAQTDAQPEMAYARASDGTAGAWWRLGW